MSNNTLETLAAQLEAAEAKIDELETKVAFQEYTIDQLNDALTSQQHQIDKMQSVLRVTTDKLKAMEPSNIAKMSEETPPPHY